MLDIKEPFLFDGAFGTYYASLYDEDMPCELANIQYPSRVLQIHREYCEAGANAIKTNTFSANAQNLDCTKEELENIIHQGYLLAKDIGEEYQVEVFADIGPMAQQKGMDLFKEYQAIVDIFLSLGANRFLFETFYNDIALKEICAYIKEKSPQSYIITSFALSGDGYTRQGISGEKLLMEMDTCPYVDAIGMNCICGPMHLDRILQGLSIKHHKISVMPNSGYPTILHNRPFFRDNSTYYANAMMQIITHGASIIGGCCGTTPAYIKAIRKQLKIQSPKVESSTKEIKNDKKEIIDHDPFHQKIKRGEKIIAVEFDPPNHCDIEHFMDNAAYLKQAGVDALTIADCPVARARVDSSLLACKLHREMGMHVIPHMTCRDRNINATKALLFGLQIEGVHNVLVVTGDPIPAEDRKQVKGVFNFNSQLLAGFINDLNQTTFPQPFLICGALNINAVNFKAELEKARKKEKQGVTAFMSQPVLSKQAYENLKLAKQALSSKIFGGIIPIVSHRNAVYMNNEISGIDVDQEIIDLYVDKDRTQASELAVTISCEIAEKIYDLVDGFYLITPFNRVDIIGSIVAHIQSLSN